MIHPKNKIYHGKVVKVSSSGYVTLTVPNACDWDSIGKTKKLHWTWYMLREKGYTFPRIDSIPKGYRIRRAESIFLTETQTVGLTYEESRKLLREITKRENRSAKKAHGKQSALPDRRDSRSYKRLLRQVGRLLVAGRRQHSY